MLILSSLVAIACPHRLWSTPNSPLLLSSTNSSVVSLNPRPMLGVLIDSLPRRVSGGLATFINPRFRHKALHDHHTKPIRLVTIHPPTFDFLLHYSLEEADLDSHENSNLEYDALSYTWFINSDIGEPNKGRVRLVICNDQAFEAHQNLYNGLLQLRGLNRPLTIWMDAICIDQDNDEEKSTQVNMMGDIFGGARTVIVWLGRKTPLTTLASKFLQPHLSKGELKSIAHGLSNFRSQDFGPKYP